MLSTRAVSPFPAMRVKYSQTPPPVVEEDSATGVRVTKQLTQLSLLGFSGAERECARLLSGQPAKLVFTIGSSLAVRDLDTKDQLVHVGHR